MLAAAVIVWLLSQARLEAWLSIAVVVAVATVFYALRSRRAKYQHAPSSQTALWQASRGGRSIVLSWNRSGFSVHNRVFAHPGDSRDFEALVRYTMRSPVSLTRLRFTPGAKEVVYARKGGHDASESVEDDGVGADEFVARVLVQIPDPGRHIVRYYGAYSNRAPGAAPKGRGSAPGKRPGRA
jgi:hypothetical protein